MTNEQLKISFIARNFGTELIKSGISVIRNASFEFKPLTGQLRAINNALDKIGGLPLTALDLGYNFTSWQNWQKITDILYRIVKDFKWEAEVFDCDNRSSLMLALCSTLFKLNTCGMLYCEVKIGNQSFRHYANIIITPDEQVYIFDVDNGGMTMKINNKEFTMGNWQYKLLSARIY